MNAVDLRDYLAGITQAVSNICRRADGTVVHDPGSAQDPREALCHIIGEADAALARMERAGLTHPGTGVAHAPVVLGPGGDYRVEYTPCLVARGEGVAHA